MQGRGGTGRPGDRLERGGIGGDELFLLGRGELDHAPLPVGIAEGGKDPSGDAEVRMVHVLALLGSGQPQGETAEIGGSRGHQQDFRRTGAERQKTLKTAGRGPEDTRIDGTLGLAYDAARGSGRSWKRN